MDPSPFCFRFIGPFALIDLPFTFVADTASLPFSWL
ncbi:YceK/YidQ family lipoprotein [Pseudomonas frederiksbergensis]